MMKPKLSKREFEILGLVAKGYTDEVIAGTLMLAEPTIGNHLRTIYDKLEVSNRREAVAAVFELKPKAEFLQEQPG